MSASPSGVSNSYAEAATPFNAQRASGNALASVSRGHGGRGLTGYMDETITPNVPVQASIFMGGNSLSRPVSLVDFQICAGYIPLCTMNSLLTNEIFSLFIFV